MLNKKGNATAVTIVILSILVLIFGALAAGYFYCTQIRFDYVSGRTIIVVDDEEKFNQLNSGEYGFTYPFFGNSTAIGGKNGEKKGGGGYGIMVGPVGKKTEENIAVYSAVNDVIGDYGYSLSDKYYAYFITSYTVENDRKNLTVNFKGQAFSEDLSEVTAEFEKRFIFDIEDASLKNLPTLIYES